MPHRVTFSIWGKEFYPSRVGFQFTRQQDPGAIGETGRHRGQPIPYGSAAYDVPASIPNTKRIKHLVLTIEPILESIRAAGATSWGIDISRYYCEQCNESYSAEEVQLVARLGCGFSYSAYSVTEDRERELERQYEPFQSEA